MIKESLKIAISGKSGCGNSTVSKLLSQTLNLPMINYTFRNMAVEKGMQLSEILALAETDETWDRSLDAKQIELAKDGGCVLGSRLAIWLLEDADLKIYLSASSEVRAARIHKREGGEFVQIYKETMERDASDHARYLKLYNIDNDDHRMADLHIDTSNRPPERVLDDIIYMLRIKKLIFST